MDDIQDRNGFVGDDIHELMRNMNPDFYTQFSPSGEEYLFYKGRLALFVINYERTRHEEMDFNKYRSLRWSPSSPSTSARILGPCAATRASRSMCSILTGVLVAWNNNPT